MVRAEAGGPYFISIVEDLTEHERDQARIREQALALVRANEELELRIRQRTAELEASNAQLRTFAYSLAHDLRGPLASTDGFARQLELLLGDRLDERARHYLNRVRAGVQSMSDLTDALLSLANLSQEPLQRASVDLSALARAWLARTREREPQRQATVDIADTPRVEGDARLLTVLVGNLLDNAWKFTCRRDDARIAFSARRTDEGIEFTVSDNGAGFDPAYIEKLFLPFQRLHPAHEFTGTGMGLAIVHKIVQRHGGRVWAQSRPDEGASFHFVLGSSAVG
jgi:signal transduction histidine kinase